MNNTQNQTIKKFTAKPSKKDYFLPASILISALIISGTWIYTAGLKVTEQNKSNTEIISEKEQTFDLEEIVLPSKGVVLPVTWDDLGKQMVEAGVIDKDKFESLYEQRGGLDKNEINLLYGDRNGNIKITSENSGFLLNLFWALGLGTKNEILDNGPIQNPRYGSAGNFASTGGWTLAADNVMDHYSGHPFIVLTSEQQQRVESVSKNIYRPCCDNATYFPDCNHGMAMLGLLELMASQDISEQEMYKAALQVNAYWFPITYLTIAKYLSSVDIDWKNADPKEILGANYSSGSGYQRILSQVSTPVQRSGGGCGV